MGISFGLLMPDPLMFFFGGFHLGSVVDLFGQNFRHVVHLVESSTVVPILHLRHQNTFFFSRQKLNLAFYLDFLPVPGDIVVSTPQITPSFLLLCFGDVRDCVPVQISTQTVLAVILICQINIFQNVVGFVA
jgi:uncharacterized membrane protein